MVHAATSVAAVGALALTLVATATAANATAECTPLDLVNFNLTDYIRFSVSSDFL